MWSKGVIWATIFACSGCAFDTSGATGQGLDGSDAAAGGVDAGLIDASPEGPDGTLRSVEGTVDLGDQSFEDWGVGDVIEFSIEDSMDFHPVASYSPSASLTFASIHDDDYIYFALIVKDDNVLPGERPLWRDDSIAIYLDAGGDHSGPLGDDDHEIVISSDGKYFDYAPGPTEAVLDGSSFFTEDGYALEIGVRKDSLGISPLPPVIGFTIAINDDDTNGDATFGLWYRKSQTECPSCCEGFEHPEPWCDTSIYGSIILE